MDVDRQIGMSAREPSKAPCTIESLVFTTSSHYNKSASSANAKSLYCYVLLRQRARTCCRYN
jgi:hypothetical protein